MAPTGLFVDDMLEFEIEAADRVRAITRCARWTKRRVPSSILMWYTVDAFARAIGPARTVGALV